MVGVTGVVGRHVVGAGVGLVGRAGAVAVGRVGHRSGAGAQAAGPGHRARTADLGAAVVSERTGAHRGRRRARLRDGERGRGVTAGVVGVARVSGRDLVVAGVDRGVAEQVDVGIRVDVIQRNADRDRSADRDHSGEGRAVVSAPRVDDGDARPRLDHCLGEGRRAGQEYAVSTVGGHDGVTACGQDGRRQRGRSARQSGATEVIVGDAVDEIHRAAGRGLPWGQTIDRGRQRHRLPVARRAGGRGYRRDALWHQQGLAEPGRVPCAQVGGRGGNVILAEGEWLGDHESESQMAAGVPRVAIGVGRDRAASDEPLSVKVHRAGCRWEIGKELHGKGRVRNAVQRSQDGRVAGWRHGGGQVRSGLAVVGRPERDSTERVHVDRILADRVPGAGDEPEPEATVLLDAIAQDLVAAAGGIGVANRDAPVGVERGVEGDEVAGTGGQPADHVAIAVQGDARPGVAEGPGPGHVGADEVSSHEVSISPDDDSTASIGGDDVAGGRVPAADDVVRGVDLDPIAAVPHRSRARGVRADLVPLDQIPRGITLDQDTPERVPRDEVARPGRRSADRVVGTVGDEDAVIAAERLGTGRIRAEVIPLNDVAAGIQEDLDGSADHDVSGRRRRSADRVPVGHDVDGGLITRAGGARRVGAEKIAPDDLAP